MCRLWHIGGFWARTYAWQYCCYLKYQSERKIKWYLSFIYTSSLTRGRSNCFWIKLVSHKKDSPTTKTVKHGRSLVQRRIICHTLNLILRSHLIIQSKMLIRSTMIKKMLILYIRIIKWHRKWGDNTFKISNQSANCDGVGVGRGDDADITYQSLKLKLSVWARLSTIKAQPTVAWLIRGSIDGPCMTANYTAARSAPSHHAR